MLKARSTPWPGRALLALIAGAIAPLALSPYGLWPLGVASLVLFLYCLQDLRAGKALWVGGLYGLGLYGAGVSWVYHSIHVYGYAPAPLAASLTFLFVAGLALLFCASFAWVFARFLRDCRSGNLLGFPALWVVFEWIRSWFLTGFPWLYAGYAHTDTWLANWAPVTGVYGLSFIVALSASLLYQFIFTPPQLARLPRYAGYAAGLLMPWLLALPLGVVSWTQAKDDPVTVTLVQPNITQDVKWQPEQRYKTLRLLYQQTRGSLASDLIIWPENAVPLFFDQARPFLQQVEQLLKPAGTAVITGLPYREQSDTSQDEIIHNSVAVLGAGNGLYHKQKLVPFGEYVPLDQWLRGLINFFNLPMSTFRPGPADQPPLKVATAGQTLHIAPFICYEIVYPDFVSKLARQSDLLLTISDDSWFGTSAGPLQHLQMARMRALENGRYLLRGTNTGVTAIIDPQGQIVARAKAFSQENLSATVTATIGHTPYSRWASWPVLLLCGLLLARCTLQRKGLPENSSLPGRR